MHEFRLESVGSVFDCPSMRKCRNDSSLIYTYQCKQSRVMLTEDEHQCKKKERKYADAIILYVGIYRCGCKQESLNICSHAHIYLTKITYHSQAMHTYVRVETLGLCSFIKSTFSDLPKNPTEKPCMP